MSQPAPSRHLHEQDQVSILLARVEYIEMKLDDLHALLSNATKPFYTVGELAKNVGRSPYIVRCWVADGKIKAIRLKDTGPRGRLLISRSETLKISEAGLNSRSGEHTFLDVQPDRSSK